MRRNLEPRKDWRDSSTTSWSRMVTVSRDVRSGILADLRELIEALDRRVPHLEREGEHRIAQDASLLRRQAQERIAEIEASLATGP